MILIQHIEHIIRSYRGHPPLHHYLKAFFRQHPILGSRDRRIITDAVYNYYRFAPFFPKSLSSIAIIQQGLRLNEHNNVFLEKIIENALPDPFVAIQPNLDFAKKQLLFSQGISEDEWLSAQMQQPNLFIRIHKNLSKNLQILKEQNFPLQTIKPLYNDSLAHPCISLPNGSKIDKLLAPEDYVVQDLSTQSAIWETALFRAKRQSPTTIWDACSGSGGKSILWKELFPDDFILATDIRESILSNLQKRFKLYNLKGFETAILDAASPQSSPIRELLGKSFDYIICDVPCSGSGTWARTPERFYFFKEKTLEKFASLQHPIAFNTSNYLKTGGLLIYITCSVFVQENERVVERLQQQSSLNLLHQELINGISQKSDSAFLAIFKKDS